MTAGVLADGKSAALYIADWLVFVVRVSVSFLYAEYHLITGQHVSVCVVSPAALRHPALQSLRAPQQEETEENGEP
jgi:hypothetical protein